MSERLSHITFLNQMAKSYNERDQKKIIDLTCGRESLDGVVYGTSSLPSVEVFLKQHKEKIPDLLGIGGGDGTIGETLTLVREIWGCIPVIIPYALGTMNNWAIPFNASDGFVDKLKILTGVGDTKPVQVARHLNEIIEAEKEIHTEEIGLFDVNGKCALNVGFGIVSRLLWLYDGRTIAEYNLLNQGDNIPSCRNGTSGLYRASHTAMLGILGGFGIHKSAKEYFEEELDVEIYVDGKKKHLPQNPTAILTSAYKQANLGVKWPMPKPIPGARDRPGEMQVAITYLTPREIVAPQNLWKIFTGQQMDRTEYLHCKAFQIKNKSNKDIHYQRDGEQDRAKDCEVSYAQPLNVISLNPSSPE